ncbi:MAG: hypothetical protein P9M14_16085, partial [Candidatus Alcyoniella australis]|nr:hypothetical protein [Candidatus Alcyoniella australis]
MSRPPKSFCFRPFRLTTTLFVLAAAALVCSAGNANAGLADESERQHLSDMADREAIIEIDLDLSLSTVSPSFYGANVISGGHFSANGGGVWDPDAQDCGEDIYGCYAPDVLALTQAAGLATLRYPGGMQVRQMDWRQGVGSGGVLIPFGTDEFLTFAREVGAEPILQVSLYDPITADVAGSEVIQSAVDYVTYINGTDKQDRVTYWELDSQPWEGFGTEGAVSQGYQAISPEIYAQAFLEFSQAMKAVDPDIKIGADAYEVRDANEAEAFLRTFVDSGVDDQYWPDYLVIHFLRPDFAPELCDLYGRDLELLLEQIVAATLAAPRELVTRVTALNDLKDYVWQDQPSRSSSTLIAIASFNTGLTFAEQETNFPGQTPPPCPFRHLRYSLLGAMFNADVLVRLSRLGQTVQMASLHNLADTDEELPRGMYGMIQPDNSGAYSRPNQLLFEMLVQDLQAATPLVTDVKVLTFDNVGRNGVSAYGSITTGADESFIRVRMLRHREIGVGVDACGPGNIHNPDIEHYISGSAFFDRMTLTPDDEDPFQSANLLTNGDFEDDLNGWTYQGDPSGASTSVECGAENCVLQIEFADAPNNNPAYTEVLFQTVEVEPESRYSLTYSTSTDQLDVHTPNLLCDPSFELSDVGAYDNLYWWPNGTLTNTEVIDSDCLEGDRCAEVTFTGNPNYYHVYQRYYLRAEDPSAYLLEGYIRTQDLLSNATLEVQARNAADQYIQTANPLGIFDSHGWTKLTRQITLYDREQTAKFHVFLRRKPGAKELGGNAVWDYVTLRRDPALYAPKIAVDVCQDSDCTVYRTIETAGQYGTRDWNTVKLSGTPYITAQAYGHDESLAIVLINKDPLNNTEAAIS